MRSSGAVNAETDGSCLFVFCGGGGSCGGWLIWMDQSYGAWLVGMDQRYGAGLIGMNGSKILSSVS